MVLLVLPPLVAEEGPLEGLVGELVTLVLVPLAGVVLVDVELVDVVVGVELLLGLLLVGLVGKLRIWIL